MNTITIPKKLARQDDLVVLPRKDYEALLAGKQTKEFAPTAAQKKALAKAERNLARGKSITYNDLVRKLGFAN